MATYPFMQVDAFTDRPLGGNPCAILFDADDLDGRIMLAIAREMNLSETSFVCRSQVADFKVRYFTPSEEIPMAGHPTIATTYALIDSGRFKLSGEVTTLSLELKNGPITVEIYAPGGKIACITMHQRKPEFLATYEPLEVMPVFGLEENDILPNVPLQTVSTGTPQLMIPVRDINVLKRVRVDSQAFQALRKRSDFFSVHLFCLCGATSEGDTFARHFATPPDILEDPFTGSATGGMAAYLWHYNLIERPFFTAEQGHWMNRPGKATVEVVGPRHDIQTVKVGGRAVTLIRGEFILDES